MYRMTDEEFERAVEEALASIPERFIDALENVTVVIQDEPTPYQLGLAEEDPSWELPADDLFWDDSAADEEGEEEEGGLDEGEEGPLPEPGPDDFLGLYDGIPLTERDGAYDFEVPDVITVFKGAHERSFDTREEMVEEIRKTVVHEIGHYFGMDEEAIARMGYE